MSMGNNIIHAEYIGKHGKVVESTNKDLEGIEGTIVDETKHLLAIETSTGVKNVPKKGSIFEIDGERVSGDTILAPPEERIKLKVK